MTKPFLPWLCLFTFACEAPIDLGERGPASGGSSGYDSSTTPGSGGRVSSTQATSIAPSVCGDGIVDAGETCDDGNAVSGDGCSSSCRELETGALCPTPGAPCQLNSPYTNCGDGVLDAGETCDDGNVVSNDGCSFDCKEVEAGYLCPPPGAPCQLNPIFANCGNGIVDTTEACDDGNRSDGDGCSQVCLLEAGWTCTATPSSICVETCGDGIVTAGEECDAGTANDDAVYGGCRFDCRLAEHCGDGIVTADEECDAGMANDDAVYGGCRLDCVLAARCGDGIVNGLEQCDDGINNGINGCGLDCSLVGPNPT